MSQKKLADIDACGKFGEHERWVRVNCFLASIVFKAQSQKKTSQDHVKPVFNNTHEMISSHLHSWISINKLLT